WFGEAKESFLHNFSEDKETAEFCVENGTVMLKMVPETPLQFGVAERLSRTFRPESTGIRVEAPKMLWADSVSTTYLIYRIPYVPIGLRILEEEWRGKDTSLAHLKVFGCDSFVRVKDVCGEAMKCIFIGSGSNEMRYSFRDTKSYQVIRSRDITSVDTFYEARSATDSSSLTKPIQKSQVVLVDIPENLAENDSIVAKHGLSSEVTKSLGGSSDTSEGFEISRSFEDSGRSDEEYSKDGEALRLHKYEDPLEIPGLRKESVQWKNAINEEMVSLEKEPDVFLSQNISRKEGITKIMDEPSYVGALNDTSTQHKSESFQLAGQEENLECRLKEILYGLIQAPRLRYLKFDSFMQKDKDGDEIEVEVMRSFNCPPGELITEDDVLPERGYSQFNDHVPYVWRYKKVIAVALFKGRWLEVYKDYLRRRAVKLSASKWEIVEL
ncbi:retrovirus-related pol polyprotein from transposon TNT 1-94, partial [Tanacetum coccineum]